MWWILEYTVMTFVVDTGVFLGTGSAPSGNGPYGMIRVYPRKSLDLRAAITARI
jgi:hypothetical protein